MAQPAERAELSGPGIWTALLRACVLVAVLVAAALALRRTGAGLLHAVHPGWQGAGLLIGAGGVMVAAGLPRQVLAFAAGYAFGAPSGAVIALVGQMLGCVLDYAAARGLAAGLVRRLLARPAGQRLRRLLTERSFTATLTLRLLPVGSNMMLNLLAGAVQVKPAAFLGATLIGYVPQTVIFALLGSGTQIGRTVQLEVGAALFVCASLLGVALYRGTAGRRADA